MCVVKCFDTLSRRARRSPPAREDIEVAQPATLGELGALALPPRTSLGSRPRNRDKHIYTTHTKHRAWAEGLVYLARVSSRHSAPHQACVCAPFHLEAKGIRAELRTHTCTTTTSYRGNTGTLNVSRRCALRERVSCLLSVTVHASHILEGLPCDGLGLLSLGRLLLERLCPKQDPPRLGQNGAKPASAASGDDSSCPTLQLASGNQPPVPHWPATPDLLST